MYTLPRGTQDILAQEQKYWHFVREKAEGIGHLYNYQPIDTPIFEETSLFVRSVGEGTDIVEKEMYSFTDNGGTMLTLRPEGTAPVCRAYLQHGLQHLPQPVKLYYWAPIFRYDRPQAGRYRQHYQFGCEALGEDDPALDAEVIEMAWRFYETIGLQNLTLYLNSIGCSLCRPAYLMALKDYYASYISQICEDCQRRLEKNPLRLLDCKNVQCQPVAEGALSSLGSLCETCQDHFSQLKKYLVQQGVPFQLSHRLVRGLDYYTRTVFEIQPQEDGAQSTIGGGGRYDGLLEQLGGGKIPAVGFATGVERIIMNMKAQGIEVPPLAGVSVFIAYLDAKSKETALQLLSQLRSHGIAASCTFNEKSLKAQLRHSQAQGVPWVLIIGEEERKKGTIILRDMKNSQQRTVDMARIMEELPWIGSGKIC